MKSFQYSLCLDAFVCQSGSHWIILHSRRDEYLCIAQSDVESIAPWLHGLACEHGATSRAAPTGSVQTLLGKLMSRGILEGEGIAGKPFSRVIYDAPTSSLSGTEDSDRTALSVASSARLMSSLLAADWRLRARSLASTLRAVTQRRQRKGSRSSRFYLNSTPSLLRTFNRLRPLYPRDYLCIFDSLALATFLGGYGMFPRWVFGVIAEPFLAHCWLQEGPVIIGDDLERVLAYTPIMVV